MKRLSIIVAALALTLGLSQCKKEQSKPTNEDGTVAITLDIKSNSGTRVDVNTGTGEVSYQSGDVVYVVSSGKFIGTLTHNGTNFNGTIAEPTEGEPLYFYFLGNVTPTETLTQGVSESCSVIISDQTNRMPVIECAPSNENYVSGATTYTAMLLNKCALVKFNVATASSATTCITGFNNKVTIDFTDASFSYSMEDEGNIILPAGSGEKWAILLPQEALEIGEAGSAYSVDGVFTGTRGTIPPINENDYLTTEIPVIVVDEANSYEVPIGAIDGKFTINANGGRVYFSQGNLQYQASTDTWQFAEAQYDYVGSANSNISPTYDGWIDLFGWGTGNNPTETSTSTNPYSSFNDWGVNAISNGGNTENSGWHTLNSSEWVYLFNTRNTASGIRYAKAIVNDVNGVILLPDDWMESTYALNDTNGGNYNSNFINASDWTNIIEANGAIFLPAAGYRFSISVWDSGSKGYYCSSSSAGNYNSGMYYVSFSSTGLNPNDSGMARAAALSVRLARNVQ